MLKTVTHKLLSNRVSWILDQPRSSVLSNARAASTRSSDIPDLDIPKCERKTESVERQKARLLYQSRKRGMLENGLLLSTFADKYLSSLTPELTNQYDKFINEPSNDWDIYYWLTGKEEPPTEFKNEIFQMLKSHTQNKLHEQRYRQPDIRFS